MLMTECWLIPVARYSLVNGQTVLTTPEYWVAKMVWAVKEIDGKRASGLMAAFPTTETVTGALTSTWTGKPMSDGNMTCIGDKSMVFWKLIFNSVEPVRREVGFCNENKQRFADENLWD